MLIIAPTFNSDKRIALGTNNVCVGGKAQMPLIPEAHSGGFVQLYAAKMFPLRSGCLFAKTFKLSSRGGRVFVGKFSLLRFRRRNIVFGTKAGSSFYPCRSTNAQAHIQRPTSTSLPLTTEN